LHALVSAHAILRVTGGEFVSLTDPPELLRQAAEQCDNQGVWPVLGGEPGSRDCMLVSPIILSDYPQVAPESAGDLFDGAEIDEILTLRILTMTDSEKEEMRQMDERTRRILERTESLSPSQLMQLHGVLRNPHALASDPGE
jgi:hydrogenase maturation protease